MTKLKVVTLVGTRPEIIRLSRVIPLFDIHTDHKLVHTGQNSDAGLSEVFFSDLNLRPPDEYLNVDLTSLGTQLGDLFVRLEKFLDSFRPDALLVLGDTNSALGAILARRRGVPVYHMEAGNRSFDENVPEEINRRMIDHVADFNLPYNKYSYQNLLGEGLHPRRMIITGSPMREIFAHLEEKIANSNILRVQGLDESQYFLVSAHRQENLTPDSRLTALTESLNLLASTWNLPVIVSTHPRLRDALGRLGLSLDKNVRLADPFGYIDYNRLQLSAKCVLSDSGTISEESAIMGFPAVTIRDSMERPEAMETAHIEMCGLKSSSVLPAVERSIQSKADSVLLPDGYEVTNFSERVLGFVMSTAERHADWMGIRK